MKFPYFCFILMIFFQCSKEKTTKKPTGTFEYLISVQLKDNTNDITLFYPEINQTIIIPKSKLPFKTCVVANSSSIAYLNKLNLLDCIKGVSEPETIYNKYIHHKISEDSISLVGDYQTWDIEKIMVLKPEVIFTIYNPNFLNTYDQLRKAGIIIVFIQEYQEFHPLGRTEYLKIFGTLFNRKELSNQYFATIKNNYKELSQKAMQYKPKPVILSKIMYGDIWYMPSGDTYSAILYKDAGGNYPWKNTRGNKSIPLSFEAVYSKTRNADIWVEASNAHSLRDLKSHNTNYQLFKPFQSKKVFSNMKRENKFYANDFYETGVIDADIVLKDLIKIFHPNQIEHTLYYYQHLE